MNETTKTILIISAIILIVIILFLVLFLKPIRRRYLSKHFRSKCGSLVYKIALDNDYYLINELILSLNQETKMHIDHLLFGDKYIYLITDRFYSYPVLGEEHDNNWIMYKKKRKTLIDNPLLTNEIRGEKLSLISGFSSKFIITIVVVNDDAIPSGIKTESPSNFITSFSKLKKLIGAIEKRQIPNLNERDLERAVKDMANLNERKKTY